MLLIQRLVMQDIEYKGYTIKKGNFVALSPMASHRLPTFHNEPLKFNPDRFTSSETTGNSRHAWIPFGG